MKNEFAKTFGIDVNTIDAVVTLALLAFDGIMFAAVLYRLFA